MNWVLVRFKALFAPEGASKNDTPESPITAQITGAAQFGTRSEQHTESCGLTTTNSPSGVEYSVEDRTPIPPELHLARS